MFSEMTVGHIWDMDLRKNETAVREIITQAQGEMALEEYLKQVCFVCISVDLLDGTSTEYIVSNCQCRCGKHGRATCSNLLIIRTKPA